MLIEVKNNTNPQVVIDQLETWMMYVSGLTIKYSIVRVTLNVEASKLDQVIAQLPQGEIIITDVTGPTEKSIQSLKEMMPNKSNIVIFCGILGMITGLSGLFIDSISAVIRRFRDKLIELKR